MSYLNDGNNLFDLGIDQTNGYVHKIITNQNVKSIIVSSELYDYDSSDYHLMGFPNVIHDSGNGEWNVKQTNKDGHNGATGSGSYDLGFNYFCLLNNGSIYGLKNYLYTDNNLIDGGIYEPVQSSGSSLDRYQMQIIKDSIPSYDDIFNYCYFVTSQSNIHLSDNVSMKIYIQRYSDTHYKIKVYGTIKDGDNGDHGGGIYLKDTVNNDKKFFWLKIHKDIGLYYKYQDKPLIKVGTGTTNSSGESIVYHNINESSDDYIILLSVYFYDTFPSQVYSILYTQKNESSFNIIIMEKSLSGGSGGGPVDNQTFYWAVINKNAFI